MIKQTTLSLFVAFALAACGGSAAEGEHHEMQSAHEGGEATQHEGHEGHEGAEEEHGNMPAEVHAFHDVMAPVWHSEEGEARGALACEHAQSFADSATAIQGAATPEAAMDDEAAWQTAVANLMTATADLTTECGGEGAEAEAKLSAIHDAFHAVVDQLRHE